MDFLEEHPSSIEEAKSLEKFGELIFCSLFFRDSAKCALSISARDDGVVSIEAF